MCGLSTVTDALVFLDAITLLNTPPTTESLSALEYFYAASKLLWLWLSQLQQKIFSMISL